MGIWDIQCPAVDQATNRPAGAALPKAWTAARRTFTWIRWWKMIHECRHNRTVYVYVYVIICICMYMYIYIYISIYLLTHLSNNLLVYVCIYSLSIYFFICIYICGYIYICIVSIHICVSSCRSHLIYRHRGY